MGKYDYLKDKLNEISKDANLITGEDGMIGLDSNNWDHVRWWYDNDDAETFMDENRERIEKYVKDNDTNLFDAVEILMQEDL